MPAVLCMLGMLGVLGDAFPDLGRIETLRHSERSCW
jgi:hypothetical protein